MTENLDSGSTESVAVSGSEAPSAAPVANQAPVESSAPEGRYMTQSEIDKMVKTAKKIGEDKVRKMYNDNNQNVASAPYQQQNSQAQSNGQYLTADEARRIAQEEYQAQVAQQMNSAYEQQVHQTVQKVAEQIKSRQEAYPDMMEKLSVVHNFDNAPNSLMMMGDIDNAGDVAYELASNPRKLIELEEMAATYPLAARQQLEELSNSIKQNQTASSAKSAPSPLTPVQPSNVSVDNGNFSGADLRRIVAKTRRR